MTRSNSLKKLVAQATEYMDAKGPEQTTSKPLPGLMLYRQFATTELAFSLYEPVICLILQGQKETRFAEHWVAVAPGDALLVSHALHVTSKIVQASAAHPFLSVVIPLDLRLLRSLYEEIGGRRERETTPESRTTFPADPRLIDCLSRYLSLADEPLEAKVLAPSVLRELHFRLLIAPQGGMLRELLRVDSHASNITRALATLREGFRGQIAIPALAKNVGMSTSSFHKYFRAITSSTPLQYQKNLRLLEAKRLLTEGSDSVTEVAYVVGYTSPNQFSREYTRKFGVSPREHRAH